MQAPRELAGRTAGAPERCVLVQQSETHRRLLLQSRRCWNWRLSDWAPLAVSGSRQLGGTWWLALTNRYAK
jgi:hypothetical protein